MTSPLIYTPHCQMIIFIAFWVLKENKEKRRKTESKIASLFIISLIIIIITGSYGDDEPPFKINKREKGKARKELESMRVELYRNAIQAIKDSGNHQELPLQFTEEQAFGRTVSETLSRFSARQKAIARKRISDVLFEVEMGIENMQPNAMFPGFSGFCSQPNYQRPTLANSQQPNYTQTPANSQFPLSPPEQSPTHYTF